MSLAASHSKDILDKNEALYIIFLMIDYSNLELVGFDGTVSAPCARNLPVYRHNETRLYFAISGEKESIERINKHCWQEVLNWQNFEGRLTLPGLSDGGADELELHVVPAFTDAVAVFATEPLRELLGIASAKDLYPAENIRWTDFGTRTNNQAGDKPDERLLSFGFEHGKFPAFSLAYMSRELSGVVMESWAEQLYDKAIRSMGQFHKSKEKNSLNSADRYLQSALFAAREKETGPKIYLLRAAICLLNEDTQRFNRFHSIYQQRYSSTIPLDEFTAQAKQLNTSLEAQSNHLELQ